jgi:hypothetical protein
VPYQTEKRSEAYYRRIFHKSGYLLRPQGDAAARFADAAQHISPKIYGEVIPTVGDGVRAQVVGCDGIIIIGPFNCLPFRIAEAILKPLSIQRGMPILTTRATATRYRRHYQTGGSPHTTGFSSTEREIEFPTQLDSLWQLALSY